MAEALGVVAAAEANAITSAAAHPDSAPPPLSKDRAPRPEKPKLTGRRAQTPSPLRQRRQEAAPQAQQAAATVTSGGVRGSRPAPRAAAKSATVPGAPSRGGVVGAGRSQSRGLGANASPRAMPASRRAGSPGTSTSTAPRPSAPDARQLASRQEAAKQTVSKVRAAAVRASPGRAATKSAPRAQPAQTSQRKLGPSAQASPRREAAKAHAICEVATIAAVQAATRDPPSVSECRNSTVSAPADTSGIPNENAASAGTSPTAPPSAGPPPEEAMEPATPGPDDMDACGSPACTRGPLDLARGEGDAFRTPTRDSSGAGTCPGHTSRVSGGSNTTSPFPEGSLGVMEALLDTGQRGADDQFDVLLGRLNELVAAASKATGLRSSNTLLSEGTSTAGNGDASYSRTPAPGPESVPEDAPEVTPRADIAGFGNFIPSTGPESNSPVAANHLESRDRVEKLAEALAKREQELSELWETTRALESRNQRLEHKHSELVAQAGLLHTLPGPEQLAEKLQQLEKAVSSRDKEFADLHKVIGILHDQKKNLELRNAELEGLKLENDKLKPKLSPSPVTRGISPSQTPLVSTARTSAPMSPPTPRWSERPLSVERGRTAMTVRAGSPVIVRPHLPTAVVMPPAIVPQRSWQQVSRGASYVEGTGDRTPAPPLPPPGQIAHAMQCQQRITPTEAPSVVIPSPAWAWVSPRGQRATIGVPSSYYASHTRS